jgi:hypothetical protein
MCLAPSICSIDVGFFDEGTTANNFAQIQSDIHPWFDQPIRGRAACVATGGYAIPTSITAVAPDLPEVTFKREK